MSRVYNNWLIAIILSRAILLNERDNIDLATAASNQ